MISVIVEYIKIKKIVKYGIKRTYKDKLSVDTKEHARLNYDGQATYDSVPNFLRSLLDCLYTVFYILQSHILR